MKFHQLTAVLSGLVLIGLVIAVVGRHRQINQLKREDLKSVETVPSATPVPSVERSMATAEAPLSRDELRELLKLRGEVARLRQAQPQLTALQAENSRLTSALARGHSDSPRVAVPDNYLVASRAQFVGLATPADALQSFLWSLRSRDTNALLQVLTPASRAMMAEVFSKSGTEDFFNQSSKLPGFLIKSVSENADGTANAEIQIDPHNPTHLEKFPLQRDEQGAWHLEMR